MSLALFILRGCMGKTGRVFQTIFTLSVLVSPYARAEKTLRLSASDTDSTVIEIIRNDNATYSFRQVGEAGAGRSAGFSLEQLRVRDEQNLRALARCEAAPSETKVQPALAVAGGVATAGLTLTGIGLMGAGGIAVVTRTRGGYLAAGPLALCGSGAISLATIIESATFGKNRRIDDRAAETKLRTNVARASKTADLKRLDSAFASIAENGSKTVKLDIGERDLRSGVDALLRMPLAKRPLAENAELRH